MAFNLFQKVFEKVDTTLDSYVIDTAGALIDFITPLFTSAMVIWIAIWGYLLMFGQASSPLQDVFFRVVRVGLILTIGLSISNYSDLVVDVFTGGAEAVSGAITGTGGGTAVTLDSLFAKIFGVADAAWKKGGVMNGNFGMYLIAFILLGFGVVITVIVAFLILLSKIMSAVLLAIGPLFIAMTLFNATQKFFESWLGMVMNYAVLLILATAIGDMMASIAESFVTTMSAGSDPEALANLASSAMLVVVLLLCILVLKQVPSIASSLGGGLALATQGAISGALSKMGDTASKARPTNIRRQYRQIKRDVNLAKGAASAEVNAPGRAGRAIGESYKKRFGGGNSMSNKTAPLPHIPQLGGGSKN